MYRETPLHAGWTLEADTLPERLLHEEQHAGFSLPGADALADFSDLLGLSGQEDMPDAQGDAPPRASFSLPGMLPPDVCGRAVLSKEIDFGRLCAHRALLEIGHLCGRGHIALDGKPLLTFGTGRPDAVIDLTDAMRLCRRQTLSICFDDAKNAGICGAAILRTTGHAWYEEITLKPDAQKQILTASIRIRAERAGVYAVRAACAPDDEAASSWRESRIHLPKPGEGTLSISFSVRAPRFEPGKRYDAPMLKLALYALSNADDRHGHLCDVRSMMTGYSSCAPRAYVPLAREECRLAPDALIARAEAGNIPALFLPAPASGLLYRRCTQEGIPLLLYTPEGASLPCDASGIPSAFPLKAADIQAFSSPSPAQACAQLCGLLASPASQCGPVPDDELLFDAAGRRLDPAAPETIAALRSLRALHLSLRAEAFRQGQYSGSLCAPGEWTDNLFFSAIRRALSPLHLSALPLRGAWWAQARFSASLQVFIPTKEQTGTYAAEAELLSPQGEVLAVLKQDCPVCGGFAGIIEARLPDTACVLTLCTRLKRSGAVVESQEIPVYVGLRGPLEAAFSR